MLALTFFSCQMPSQSQVTDDALDAIDVAKEEAKEAEGLTKEQIAIIQEGWEILAKDKKGNGVAVFIA